MYILVIGNFELFCKSVLYIDFFLYTVLKLNFQCAGSTLNDDDDESEKVFRKSKNYLLIQMA